MPEATGVSAKGYWIVQIDVTDPAKIDAYRALNGKALADHGGRFLVRGGAFEVREGATRSRHLVVEFPSYAAARACYDSPDYQEALRLRNGGGPVDLVIIEGYAGAQPG